MVLFLMEQDRESDFEPMFCWKFSVEVQNETRSQAATLAVTSKTAEKKFADPPPI